MFWNAAVNQKNYQFIASVWEEHITYIRNSEISNFYIHHLPATAFLHPMCR